MAVTKVITYTDTSGSLRTATITIDLQKLSVGTESDEEEVYLTVSAPGLSSEDYWRRNVDSLVEDAIFAASGDAVSRYTTYPSGTWGGYGDKITNSGILDGEDGIEGVRQQLIALAG